jgi:hypothetical protein
MNRVFAAFESGGGPEDLTGLCLKLLSEQKKTWPDLHQGYEALKQIRERQIACKGFSVRLQFNPGRMKSSLANVENKAVNKRPCFLCRDNLPEEQRGIVFEKEYLILCNPAPVFPSHLTVCHQDHRRQSMSENVASFLQLIDNLGDPWIALYNGPKCGASAPDHLHFQAVMKGVMPIETEMNYPAASSGIWARGAIRSEKRLTEVRKANGVRLSRARGLGREILVLDGDDKAALGAALQDLLLALKRVLRSEEEAMMNVAAFSSKGKIHLLVFPRGKHRPEAFFREGDDRILVSPGVVEMGGVFVTPVERDFEKLDAAAVEAILKEVCLDEKIVDKVVEALLRKAKTRD